MASGGQRLGIGGAPWGRGGGTSPRSNASLSLPHHGALCWTGDGAAKEDRSDCNRRFICRSVARSAAGASWGARGIAARGSGGGGGGAGAWGALGGGPITALNSDAEGEGTCSVVSAVRDEEGSA